VFYKTTLPKFISAKSNKLLALALYNFVTLNIQNLIMMKNTFKKISLISIFFSFIIGLIACDDEDNNKVDPAFEIPGIDIPSRLKNSPEIIELKNTKCESLNDQIKPITQEEQDKLFAKNNVDISNQILIELNLYRKSKGLSELINNDTAKFWH